MGAPSKIRGRRPTPGPGRRLAPRNKPRRASDSDPDPSPIRPEAPPSSGASVVAGLDSTGATCYGPGASPAPPSPAHRSRSRRARSLPRVLSRTTHWSPPLKDVAQRGGTTNDELLSTGHPVVHVLAAAGPVARSVDSESPDAEKPATCATILKPSLKKCESASRSRDSARRIRFVLETPTEGHVRTTRFRRGSPFRCRRASSGGRDGRGDDRRMRTPSRSPSRSPSWRRPTKGDSQSSPSRLPSPSRRNVSPNAAEPVRVPSG